MIDLAQPEERDAAAAAFVLGTLSADEMEQVARAMDRDADLRAEVARWQDRLLPLTARVAPAVPDAAVWARIERAIAPGMAPAAGPRARRAAPGIPWWQRLALWQGLAAGALALSLVLAVRLVLPERPAERFVAVLQSPDAQATGWVVEARAGGTVRLVPVAAPDRVPEGRAWQFWTKPEGAAAPTSLGLVTPGRTLEVPAERLPALGARQLFEITLEPAGGSPVGRPTGPILFVGRTVAL